MAIGLAGCGSSTVAQHWKEPTWSGPELKNVLVMVVRKDPVRRRQWEEAFAQALTRRGMVATPSYNTFPDSVPNEAVLQQTMQDSAFDGILLSRNTGVQNRDFTMPASIATVSSHTHWSRFYGTYITSYRTEDLPAYTVTDHIVTNEITVWDGRKDGQMVWSATTATENPTNAKTLRNEITAVIVPQLAKDGIIP